MSDEPLRRSRLLMLRPPQIPISRTMPSSLSWPFQPDTNSQVPSPDSQAEGSSTSRKEKKFERYKRNVKRKREIRLLKRKYDRRMEREARRESRKYLNSLAHNSPGQSNQSGGGDLWARGLEDVNAEGNIAGTPLRSTSHPFRTLRYTG